MKRWFRALATACLLAATVQPALAEVGEIRITKQPSIIYLPLVVLEQNKLVEKHAQEAEKELTGALSAEQIRQWADYRKNHSSISFSQSTVIEGGGQRRSARSSAGIVNRPTLTAAIQRNTERPACGAPGWRRWIVRSLRAE